MGILVKAKTSTRVEVGVGEMASIKKEVLLLLIRTLLVLQQVRGLVI